ncbi:FAD-binding protein [Candidatus Woesearchaeota archaeon]|nr:FAD-binding protein [Candidatus Woesearchaeota archaeon]
MRLHFGATEIAIIGTGIAGSVVSYELRKHGVDHFICTDQKNEIRNTSAKSYGHCRLCAPEALDEIVRRSVSQLGENEEKMRFVYSHTNRVTELLDELEIPHEPRAFGVIPSTLKRGGATFLSKLQQGMKAHTDTELLRIERLESGFKLYFNIGEIQARHVVLATGGFAGKYPNTDTVTYKHYRIFDIVRELGGLVVNEECMFVHPFGYDGGTKILIGAVSKMGEFVDDAGDYVFREQQRQLIKQDRYHEIFDQLLEQAKEVRDRGGTVRFVAPDCNPEVHAIDSGNINEVITPCVHYTSGGILTDALGRVVNVPGAYALGECQANGSRKNGRFPGYPFTAAIIQGKEVARELANLSWR